jgi:hypothetical protein
MIVEDAMHLRAGFSGEFTADSTEKARLASFRCRD